MSNQPAAAAANPFRTRCIRPGAMPYIFPAGQDARQLLDRLERNCWRGEIVGPHGSGKSSLLADLLPLVEQSGRAILHIELHDGCRRLPLNLRAAVDPDSPTLVVVDGYEQLGRLGRWRLRSFRRRRDLGLLVTTHSSVGLPPLFDTSGNVQLAGRIVERLTYGSGTLITSDQLADCLNRHGPNLRETLFDLYDLYEQANARP